MTLYPTHPLRKCVCFSHFKIQNFKLFAERQNEKSEDVFSLKAEGATTGPEFFKKQIHLLNLHPTRMYASCLQKKKLSCRPATDTSQGKQTSVLLWTVSHFV